MRTGLFSLLAGVLLALGLAGASAAQSGYRVSPGDILSVEVLEDPSLNKQVLVLPDGSISFPLAGQINAGGRTLQQVSDALTARLAPNFATEPNVFVSVQALAQGRVEDEDTIDTYVMGEVLEPGKKAVTRGTTILQILAEAGGLSRFAARKRVELRRMDPQSGEMKTYLFSYNGRGRGERISGNTELIPGDVVVVPERRLFE